MDADPTPRARRGPDGPATPPSGILVVDDHPAVRSGLASLLATDPGLAPVASAATASRAIAIARRLRPAVAIVDYRLPGRDGISLTLELKRLPQPPGIVIYSAFAGVRVVLAAIVAGADGIVDKGVGARELRVVVQRVAGGKQAIPNLPVLRLKAGVRQLSGDDEQIVAMLVNGASLEQVARALEIDIEWLELRRWAIIRQLTSVGERRRSRVSRK